MRTIGAAAGRRIGQTVDAVGENLQDVGQLVADDGGDAAERFDVLGGVHTDPRWI